MKQVKHLTLTLIASMFMLSAVAQNLRTPSPSPGAKIEQTVGVSTFKLNYFRPGVKGRELFVELEKWGRMWRTGANSGTILEFDTEASFEGKKVAAGKYMVLSIPGEKEWTWILYSDTSIGGNVTLFEESKEVARFTSKTVTWDKNVERLTFEFSDVTDNSTKFGMYWGQYYTAFNITVDTETKVTADVERVMKNPEAGVGQLYAQSASYYLSINKNLDKALEWMDKAIAVNPNAFWNIHTKAQIQAKMGDKKGAIATANKSLEMAKKNEGGDFGYVKRNEDLIASIK